MVDFEKLNRETQDHNNKNVNRYNPATQQKIYNQFWQNYYNNKTYKNNNGQYSKKYY
jgi:hypothetical protein